MSNSEDTRIEQLSKSLEKLENDNSIGAKMARKRIENELSVLKAAKESENFFK